MTAGNALLALAVAIGIFAGCVVLMIGASYALAAAEQRQTPAPVFAYAVVVIALGASLYFAKGVLP
jgi:F0F1-type ATP synthase membrane subunit c/vacuolar-type H+-ATPase subunit K